MGKRARTASLARRFAGLILLVSLGPTLAPAATIGLNFTGVTMSQGMTLNGVKAYAPPDNGGGVGASHIAQLINGAYAVYDKGTGAQTQSMSARQFWTNANIDPGNDVTGLGTFNARILYDPTVDRWIAAALTGQNTQNNVMIARSETSDPSGAWKAVSFLGNDGFTGEFADFTSLGVDADGVYVTTNNYPSRSGPGGLEYVMAWSLPKADLMASTPSIDNMTQFGAEDYLNLQGFSIQPVTDFGPSKGHTALASILPLAPGEPPLYRLDVVGASGPGATLTAPVAIDVGDYVVPPKAAQPDSSRLISTLDGRTASSMYQMGDTIYMVHNTKVGANAALSVIMLDEPTNQVIQEIILSDPAFDYFNGSIAPNGLGDVVVGFTRSGLGAGGNLSAYAVIGETIGNVTTFGVPLLLKAGTVSNYHIGNNRWGDFTTTIVDPSNPAVFWTFQQYAYFDAGLNSNAWATQITQIIVPEPSSIALACVALAAMTVAAWRKHRQARARAA